jgi:hypothetical protein
VALLLLKHSPLAGEEAEIFVVGGFELRSAVGATRRWPGRDPPEWTSGRSDDSDHALRTATSATQVKPSSRRSQVCTSMLRVDVENAQAAGRAEDLPAAGR